MKKDWEKKLEKEWKKSMIQMYVFLTGLGTFFLAYIGYKSGLKSVIQTIILWIVIWGLVWLWNKFSNRIAGWCVGE